MEQYIKKSAIVAEIERRVKSLNKDRDFNYLQIKELEALLSSLDALEVKEVDLEKAIDGLTAGWIEGEEYGELQNINTCRCVTLEEVKEAMRCMFELGLKTIK